MNNTFSENQQGSKEYLKGDRDTKCYEYFIHSKIIKIKRKDFERWTFQNFRITFLSRIERRVFAPDCTRTQTHGCVHAVRFSISLILDALITAVRLVASRKNPPPSHATRFALNHRRPIIEGVLALQRRLVSGAPREIGRTTGGRALVPPFVRRRQASVVRTLVRGNYRPNRSRRTNLLFVYILVRCSW